MGKIKDGTISGFLPATEAFAVHYPGYPSSMSRAIDTLGGSETILKARSLQSTKLELHFRPEDPYSHPAFGELRPCSNLLLKICKNKSSNAQNAEASKSMLKHPSPDATNPASGTLKSQPESESFDVTREVAAHRPEEDQITLSGDIVARIPEAYHFEGMVDYQHVVAVHANVAQRKKRNWTELEEPWIGKDNCINMHQEDVMLLVPSLFALKDVPENLVLKIPSLSSSKRKQEVTQNQQEVDVEPVLAIDYNIKEIPKTVNWEEYIPQGSEQWKSQMFVSKLFSERPIWPKDSLIERLLDKGLNYRHDMIRRLLSRIAYYFSNGPFLRFWIRKGYDPRKDPESRIYQRIDFRVPQSLQSCWESNAGNKFKHRREDICAFRVFPCKFQTSLQLFELADDYIQEEIRKSTTQTSCSHATGWFSQRVLNCLRQRMMMRFLSVFPAGGAESLLRSACENFERLKRELHRDCLKLGEEADQQANTEVVGEEDKEEPDYVEDDEEDEIEVENVEEGLDMYEGHDLAGEDDEISPNARSYLNMENVSRAHLQELFGSFPAFKETGDEVEDADTSGEEYQIYEQDFDENNSDDDDD